MREFWHIDTRNLKVWYITMCSKIEMTHWFTFIGGVKRWVWRTNLTQHEWFRYKRLHLSESVHCHCWCFMYFKVLWYYLSTVLQEYKKLEFYMASRGQAKTQRRMWTSLNVRNVLIWLKIISGNVFCIYKMYIFGHWYY